MSEEKRPRVGVGVIVIQDRKVLLGLRKSEHGQGCWSPPGGHLEFGEDPKEAVLRELKEETGLIGRVDSLTLLGVTNDIFEESGKHYITLNYRLDKVVGDPQVREPDKWERWEWFSWDNMPENLFLPIVHLRKEGYTPVYKEL